MILGSVNRHQLFFSALFRTKNKVISKIEYFVCHRRCQASRLQQTHTRVSYYGLTAACIK